MAFAAMAAVLAMTSCGKEDNGTTNNGSGSNTPARYTLTVQSNNADWGVSTGSGSYADGTSVTIEAVPATGYYFIKWSDGAVSNPRTVTVNSDMTLYALFSSNPNDPNPYNPGDNPTPGSDPQPQTDNWVDLGLPSGLLWAKCNLGANAPHRYGNYYAWGETTPKEYPYVYYWWVTYRYCTVDGEGNLQTLTKYNTISTYGTIDSLVTLQAMDDAATQALGNGARTPTQEEWVELINNTTHEWTTMNEVQGMKFTAANGNTLFLPAAGRYYGSVLSYLGGSGFYWSSSLYTDDPSNARYFYIGSDRSRIYYYPRNHGFSVRAVRQN